MNHYIDNDVVIKVCVLDLVDEAHQALVLDHERAIVLVTAKYAIPKRAKKYGEACLNRVNSFLSWARTAEAAPELEDQAALDVEGIDQGEAQLFSYASRDPHSVLVTGDKRSLEALTRFPQCRPVAERLAGRVMCFELLICRMIGMRDFDALKTKIVPAMSCDTALRAAFGSGMHSESASVRTALENYVTDLRAKTEPLLAAC